MSSGSAYVYDAHASALFRLGRTDPVKCQSGIQKAVQAGGTTAALVSHAYKGPCGDDLFILGRPPMELSFLPSPSLFEPHVTAAPDGRVVLAGMIGTLAKQGIRFDVPAVETVETVDQAGKVVPEAQVRADGYDLRDIEFDDRTGGVVMLYQAHAPNGDAGTVARSVLVSLDSNFVETARWTAPAGVTVNAIAPDRRGHVILGGVRHGFGPNQVWLDALDGSTLAEAWGVPHLDGDGEALAVDVAPPGTIITMGKASSAVDTLWIHRFDGNGAPVLPNVVTQTRNFGGNANWQASVASQSDGSIFVSTGVEGFVYCP
jgi:hypothetical protein